jgi:hypothetical protein
VVHLGAITGTAGSGGSVLVAPGDRGVAGGGVVGSEEDASGD